MSDSFANYQEVLEESSKRLSVPTPDLSGVASVLDFLFPADPFEPEADAAGMAHQKCCLVAENVCSTMIAGRTSQKPLPKYSQFSDKFEKC
jgi:hypothetical protein